MQSQSPFVMFDFGQLSDPITFLSLSVLYQEKLIRKHNDVSFGNSKNFQSYNPQHIQRNDFPTSFQSEKP